MTSDINSKTLAGLQARASEIFDRHVRQNPNQTLTKSREEYLALLHEWVASEPLRKHMLAVEAAMTAYARRFGEDTKLWGATGLLHDFDYEKNPSIETHVLAGIPVLSAAGYPAPMLDAIMGHAEYLGVPRATQLAKTLYAVDELCGFLTAVAYVRPTKSLAGIEFSSVNKKIKDKAFARPVNRDQLRQAAAGLSVDFQDHVMFVARALEAAIK